MSGFERALVSVSTAWVVLTGAVYFWMKYLMSNDDPFSVIHHPWQPGALSLHVVGGPVAVFALGLIARDHILERLRDRRQRRGRGTGLVLVGLALPMIVTGYLLQVVTDETMKRVLVMAHVASGGIYAALFLGHLLASRSLKRAAEEVRAKATRRAGRRSAGRLDPPGRRGIGSWVRGRAAGAPAGREEMTP